jgi:hypothetical protein
VALLAKHVPDDSFNLDELRRVCEEHAVKHDVKWTWLALVRPGPFPDPIVKRVDRFTKPELGISLVNLAGEDVDTSSNLLGRKGLSLVRTFK